MKASIFAVLVTILATASALAETPKTKVFLFAGQSNMDGRGDGSKLSKDEQKRLTLIGDRVQFAYNHEPIRPLGVTTPPDHTKRKFKIEKSFGPELFFGLQHAEAHPEEKFLFIKRSIGGTSLYGCWNPDWTTAKAAQMKEEKKTKLYSDFIAYTKETLSTLPEDSYEICGMFWVQGEADSGVSKFGPEPAAEYGANLKLLVDSVRQDLSETELPFYLLQVGNGLVVEGMKAVAQEDPNIHLVEQSKDESSPFFLPGYGPPTGHYNYEGMKRIGLNFADRFKETGR